MQCKSTVSSSIKIGFLVLGTLYCGQTLHEKAHTNAPRHKAQASQDRGMHRRPSKHTSPAFNLILRDPTNTESTAIKISTFSGLCCSCDTSKKHNQPFRRCTMTEPEITTYVIRATNSFSSPPADTPVSKSCYSLSYTITMQFISKQKNQTYSSITRSKYLRSALFWDITHHRVALLYRRFGATYRSHLQGPRGPLDPLPSDDGSKTYTGDLLAHSKPVVFSLGYAKTS
jgi:hypothetical protein